MDIQRLRNLTTRRLHTSIDHIYADFEAIIGEKGIMTHCIPAAHRALQPWLKTAVIDERFWDGKYDTTHVGDFDLPPMSAEDKAEFWLRYGAQP